MQHHPASTRSQAALKLTNRIGAGVKATERRQPTIRPCGCRENRIVRLLVTGALHEREHNGARSDQPKRLDQLIVRTRPTLRIVPPNVCVSIEQTRPRQLLHKALQRRQQKRIRVHTSTLDQYGSRQGGSA
jgi:hypothetical protein